MPTLDRPVFELMQREVVTLQQSDCLDLADDIMRLGRIRHLPVLEGEQLVGILSSRDLLAASLSKALDFEPLQRRAFLRAVEVKEVMTQDVDTVRSQDMAREAARRMLRNQIGCVPVVDEDGRFVGLLTETDLLRAALDKEIDARIVDAGALAAEAVAREAAGSETGPKSELDELRRLRDELRLQVHLGVVEAADVWNKLDLLAQAESRAKALARKAEEPAQEVAESARRILEEIRSLYRRLRELL